MSPALPPTAVTMGDPAGIGGDITLMCWQQRQAFDLKPFLVIDDPARLERLGTDLQLNCPVQIISNIAEASEVFDRALPVLPLSDKVNSVPGQASSASAAAVVESLDRAVDLAMQGEVSAVVTNPIHKASLYQAGFNHPGHTEYLAARATDTTGKSVRPVMMLACAEIRVIPVTIHTSLRQALDDLNTDLIVETATIAALDLQRKFGLSSPRLAFAGLNPHAGEDGNMGREEIEIIAPAIDQLRAKGIECLGPMSADTMFHANARLAYDVALCMYHDQALIPIKTIDFDNGVNVTLGLPFVRTSPDHGTAFGIAGSGNASPNSLAAALRMAGEMSANMSVDGAKPEHG
jgi:4-hydroxythreonine-4-phosphate dehydrogenase